VAVARRLVDTDAPRGKAGDQVRRFEDDPQPDADLHQLWRRMLARTGTHYRDRPLPVPAISRSRDARIKLLAGRFECGYGLFHPQDRIEFGPNDAAQIDPL
jgi:hypothetical protein